MALCVRLGKEITILYGEGRKQLPFFPTNTTPVGWCGGGCGRGRVMNVITAFNLVGIPNWNCRTKGKRKAKNTHPLDLCTWAKRRHCLFLAEAIGGIAETVELLRRDLMRVTPR